MTRQAVLALLALTVAATAKNRLVRGRIDRFMPPDIVTASGVKVALWKGDTLKDSMVTSQDGMFYFVDVPKDTYRLEIAPPPEDTNLNPFWYRLIVGTKTVLNLPAQMLNRFAFERPPESTLVQEGDTLDVAGTHSYPSGTVIWFLFTTRMGRYRLLGDTVALKGRRWSSRLRVPEKATGLQAVLATREVSDTFRVKASQSATGMEEVRKLPKLDSLPQGARIIAIRRFATR